MVRCRDGEVCHGERRLRLGQGSAWGGAVVSMAVVMRCAMVRRCLRRGQGGACGPARAAVVGCGSGEV